MNGIYFEHKDSTKYKIEKYYLVLFNDHLCILKKTRRNTLIPKDKIYSPNLLPKDIADVMIQHLKNKMLLKSNHQIEKDCTLFLQI